MGLKKSFVKVMNKEGCRFQEGIFVGSQNNLLMEDAEFEEAVSDLERTG